jgi:hypothetical protein
MNKTWGEIFPGLGEPVQASVASYRAAEGECDDFRVMAEVCAEEFDRVRSSEALGELGGRAADQLITLITAVDGSFQHLPPVFASLVDIFDKHAQQLSALRREAAAALALANTRWQALEHSASASATANDALRRINNQIRSLERTVGADPHVQVQLDNLYDRGEWHQADVASCSTAVARAELELGWSRSAHATLVAVEHDLVEDTVSRLAGVDLDDLQDPSRLGQIVSNVGEYLTGLATDIVVGVVQLAEALVTEDWAGVLWRLSDLLGAVLEVVALVALVVAVIASGGLLLAVASVGLALMTAKLVVDLLLVGSQLPHPDTGQALTLQQFAVEAAVYVFAVATAGASGIGGRVLGQRAPSPAAMRSFAANLRTVLAPAATPSGARLVGATAAPSVEASGRHVVELAIDEVIVPQTQDQVESVVNGFTGTKRLTTDPSAWATPTILEFMRDSPITRDALQRINAAACAVMQLAITGPSFRPGAPVFQLCAAP